MSCGFMALTGHCLLLSFKVREVIHKSLQKTGICKICLKYDRRSTLNETPLL